MNENMKKIIKYFLFLIPGLMMLLGVELGLIYYMQTDDFEMNNISWGGSSGTPNEHIVFIKCILGRLFKLLYDLNSRHNWFGLYYLFIVLAITYAIFIVFMRYTKFSIALIVACVCEFIILSWLTFTTLAYLCCLVGIIIISEVEKGMSIKEYIIKGGTAYFFVINSFILRDDSFKTGCIILIPLIFFALRNQNKKIFLCFIICVAVGFGLINVYEKKAYGSKLWQDYLRYNSARSANVDFPIDRYENNKELYDSLNLSANDVDCLKSWLFSDKGVYTEEVLNKTAKHCSKGTRYNYTPYGILKELFKRPIAIFYICCFIVLSLAMIRLSRENKYVQILQLLFMLGLIGALFIINRPLERVIVPLGLIGVISILYMLFKDKLEYENNYKKTIVVSLVVVMLLIGMSYMMGEYEITMGREYAEKYDEERHYIWNNRDKLFVVESMERISQFRPVTKINDNDSYENTLDVGHWEIYNDIYYEKAKKYNLKYKDRLYIDLAENDNVYFLFSYYKENLNVVRLKKFVEEHTGRKINTKVIKKFDRTGDIVYKFEYDDEK